MDESILFNGVLRSLLGGRRRRSHRALRYLTGSTGSLWSNPTTLLTAAGVAWGIYETLQSGSATSGQWGGGGAAPLDATGAAGAPPVAAAPSGESSPALPAVAASVSPDTMRVLRLAISAAGADGSVSDDERKAILEQARHAGVGELVETELSHPRPLREIVAGVTDSTERATLYVLAFSVVRGDEQPTGAERIYLAQLANLLNLDPAEAERLERNAAASIDKQQ
ncbi:MAG TPA: DUF533 domain-containing protein [Vicinamibacterales bacterium]|nr:DUF533 domain-containing protein [Vicinamibacterales bacterium]